jgi:tRNA nucleotidyltransferase (CCA-adding enzyme)
MWYDSSMIRQDAFVASLDIPGAYLVGGSVRDEILGRKPKDADYVVRGVELSDLMSLIDQVGGKPSYMQTRDGRKIGARANVKGLGLVEIALPRKEVSTGPGHRDFYITTDPNLTLAEDATRRDFTINAVYRHIESGEIVDPLDGVNAIKQKVLMTTHRHSFRDDPLRILRALRFKSQLGFAFMEALELQMQDYADCVTGLTDKGVSGTALEELCKLLMGRNVAAALRNMRDFGVMEHFLPEIKPILGYEQGSRYHDMTTDEHTFTALDAAAGMHCDLRVRLALLFHDSGKPLTAWVGEDGRTHYYANEALGTVDHAECGARIAYSTLVRLNAPKKLRDDVVTIVKNHMVPLSTSTRPAKVRRWRVDYGDDLLADLLRHRLCDCMGKGEINNEQLVALERLERIREDAERHRVPASVKELKVGGEDAKAVGLAGRDIGSALRSILHEVVSQPDEKRLSRDWQLSRLEKKGSK